MKTIKSVLVAALATAGLGLAIDSQAAGHTWSGAHGGGGHWSGGGHWGGGGGHWGGGRWYGPRFGLYVGAPLLWPGYWGYYPYDYYYPRTVVVDRIVEPYPASYPDGAMAPMDDAPAVAPYGPGAPSQAPTYMNYCDSARAYYPKVTSCPEGWKFVPSQR
jgi:hypothetical protein